MTKINQHCAIFWMSNKIAEMLESGEKCDPSMVQLLYDYLESGHYSDIGELHCFLERKIGKVAV